MFIVVHIWTSHLTSLTYSYCRTLKNSIFSIINICLFIQQQWLLSDSYFFKKKKPTKNRASLCCEIFSFKKGFKKSCKVKQCACVREERRWSATCTIVSFWCTDTSESRRYLNNVGFFSEFWLYFCLEAGIGESNEQLHIWSPCRRNSNPINLKISAQNNFNWLLVWLKF